MHRVNASAVGSAWSIHSSVRFEVESRKTWKGDDRTFAVVHCMGRDLLIALVSLTLAWVVIWAVGWPLQSFRRVAALAMRWGSPTPFLVSDSTSTFVSLGPIRIGCRL